MMRAHIKPQPATREKTADGHTRRLRVRAISAAVVIGAIATGCGSAGTPQPKTTQSITSGPAQQGGALTVALATEPQDLDPSICQCDPASEQAIIQIFDQLVELPSGRSTTPVPGLAESWSTSKDQLTYTFHLRDARFSNGAPVTASDVAFSLDRLINPKVDLSEAALFGFIRTISAPNAHTVVIRLAHRFSAAIWYLAHPAASIYPKSYFQKVGEKTFLARPIGSGAFKLASWQHGVRMVLARNPHYWRTGLPHFDRLVISFVADDNARVLDVRAGNVDVATQIPYGQVGGLKQLGNYNLIVRQIGSMDSVALNERVRPLGERVVRQALNYATPGAVINRLALAGLGLVQNSALPIMRYWDAKVPAYPYNLAKARQLLSQSSAPHGFSISLQIIGTDAPSRVIAQILQNSWAQIGVHVNIVSDTYAELATTVFTKETFQAAFYPGLNTDVPVDDELAVAFLTPAGNEDSAGTHYNDPEVNRLVAQATAAGSDSERRLLFTQLQKVDVANPPWVFMVFNPQVAAARSNVGGLDYSATFWMRFDTAYRTKG
jgi:peptide/nickel transport system substrate-binding protein